MTNTQVFYCIRYFNTKVITHESGKALNPFLSYFYNIFLKIEFFFNLGAVPLRYKRAFSYIANETGNYLYLILFNINALKAFHKH